MTDKVKRNSKGHLLKGGKSLNPAGRPKKKPIIPIQMDKKTRELYKDNPLKCLLYLMNSATNEDKAYKYARAVIDYINPRLSSIKQEINKKQVFVIERADGYKLGEMKRKDRYIDVTPMSKEDMKLQKEVKAKAESIIKGNK